MIAIDNKISESLVKHFHQLPKFPFNISHDGIIHTDWHFFIYCLIWGQIDNKINERIGSKVTGDSAFYNSKPFNPASIYIRKMIYKKVGIELQD